MWRIHLSIGLNLLVQSVYRMLDLQTFFTTGDKETRAWTIKKGSTAPKAASVIHSDFEKGFIRAECVNWKELCNSSSWANARENGVIRSEGKDYVVEEGDVVYCIQTQYMILYFKLLVLFALDEKYVCILLSTAPIFLILLFRALRCNTPLFGLCRKLDCSSL